MLFIKTIYMKQILWLLLLISTVSSAQKTNKADKQVLTGLQTHIVFLADDKLEGRRTGTAGEKAAYEYISKQFAANGLIAKGEKGTYIQEFEVNEGKQINPSTQLSINGNNLLLEKDFFPFIFKYFFKRTAKFFSTNSFLLHYYRRIFTRDRKIQSVLFKAENVFTLDGSF